MGEIQLLEVIGSYGGLESGKGSWEGIHMPW